MTLRKFIQNKLEELSDIQVTTELPDDMLVENQVYFSYLLNENIINKDYDKNFSYNVTILGYLKVKTSQEVGSLDIVDNAEEQLKEKLKEINFTSNFNDVSIIDNIRKVQVTANAKYNEINNILL